MGLHQKLLYITYNFWYFVWTYPIRLYRVPRKVISTIWKLLQLKYALKPFFADFLSIFLLMVDLFGIPEIYDSIQLLVKSKTRGLSPKEKALLELMLPNTLNAKMIKVDNRASFMARKGRFAYVSYFTINLYGDLRKDIFVHELIHIWQYTRFGSEYIAQALFAQHSKEGYDYGGPDGLFHAYGEKKPFLGFNFEQQGDILADHYRMLQEQAMLSPGSYIQRRRIYDYYIKQIIDLKIYRW